MNPVTSSSPPPLHIVSILLSPFETNHGRTRSSSSQQCQLWTSRHSQKAGNPGRWDMPRQWNPLRCKFVTWHSSKRLMPGSNSDNNTSRLLALNFHARSRPNLHPLEQKWHKSVGPLLQSSSAFSMCWSIRQSCPGLFEQPRLNINCNERDLVSFLLSLST
jgi:hypothetical protein